MRKAKGTELRGASGMGKKPKTAVAKSDATPLLSHEDNLQELMVDRDLPQPPALDENIATVHLHTSSNHLKDGYDLELTGRFGKERITLASPEFEIEVDFAIIKANIELHFFNCHYAHSEKGDTHGHETTVKVKSQHIQKGSLQGSASAEGAVSLSGLTGKIKAVFKAEGSVASTQTTDITTKIPVFTRVGKTVFIEHVGRLPLDGALITNYIGWRVFPTDNDKPSRVVARLKVREDWISFTNVVVKRAPVGLLTAITSRLRNPSQQRCFEILLRHLATMELREYNINKLEATIAAHTLVVKPVEDLAVSLPSSSGAPRIAIDGNAVSNYFKGDEGFEVANLMSLGVRSEFVREGVSQGAVSSPQNLDYVPDGSPVYATELFIELHKSEETAVSSIQHQTALKDLMGLKLVSGGRGGMARVNTRVPNPEATLRYTVAQMPNIHLARSMLKTNPKTTGREIADAVALQFDKQWKRETRKRNGNSIKRWTIWLEPHLIDPTESNEAAAFVAHAHDRTVTRGRSGAFRAIHLPRVKEMLAAGKTVPEIAADIKVTRETIYNWFKWMRQQEANGPEKELVQQRMTSAYESARAHFIDGLSPHTTARRLRLPYNLAIEFHNKWLQEFQADENISDTMYALAISMFKQRLSPAKVAKMLDIDPELAEQIQSNWISAQEG